MPWNMPVQRPTDTSTYTWELYDLREDFSQSNNIANAHPGKLKEMQAIFDREARKYNVYPLQDAGGQVRGRALVDRTGNRSRMRHTYWGKDIYLQFGVAPPVFHLPFTLEADVDVGAGGGEGVIAAAGSKFGGWSFYLQQGYPVAYASVSGLPLPGAQSRVAASRRLSPGRHHIEYDFAVAGGPGGTLTISVDGEEVASGPIATRPRMLAGGGESFDTGRDTNVPVSPDYQREGIFTGRINKVEINFKIPSQGVAH